ncbi:hypothetical protein E1B28_002895 [Marasmius oreades]|uniref:Uncharacterized protein n=1 Tax=Marasmius oreades TaxID=181124 RepID=A0A9P7RLF0_9AGAR|nr:uncharacterized protein E1B28_002895 [Marasmius oreades]KAG7085328.1 hypothetical protein E1B28_002895 [Marasmius oreades]
MFVINHSLNVNILPIGDGVIVSDPVQAAETNGVQSIMNNVEGCKQFSAGRKPNFILIDFVEKGEAFKAADTLNGVT